MDSSGLTRGQLTLDTVQTAMDDSGFFRSLCRNETFRKKLGADILRIGREYLTGEKVSAYIDEYEAWLTEPMKTYFQRFFNSTRQNSMSGCKATGISSMADWKSWRKFWRSMICCRRPLPSLGRKEFYPVS